ncbi:MAG TPA: aldo/keto reductase, partial [Spirochaetota bacterium]|nr:aldo/keto reductase [Spirochaetota bacterium]
VIGFGGILVMNESADDSSRVTAKAIDAGINYFDVAPDYGNAQQMLGPALKPYRKDVFLACKTHERSAKGAHADLENSLQLLKTDHFDLYQLHAMTTKEEVEEVLGPGGAMEVLQKAREKGQARFLGFSGHSEEAVLALMDAFDFNSIMIPLSWATYLGGDFGKRALPTARGKGMAVLALKALAKKAVPEGQEKPYEKAWYHPVKNYKEALSGLRFTLGLEGVTAAVSPGEEKLFDWMLEAEKNCSPLSDDEIKTLEEKSKGIDLIFSANERPWHQSFG